MDADPRIRNRDVRLPFLRPRSMDFIEDDETIRVIVEKKAGV
jgi:hypothetical protein